MNTPRLSADARREQILDVAIDVFGRSGYFGASMNDIADAAGVTKPVLYQHFDSKSDLYSALIEEVGNRMLEAIAKATANSTDGKQQTELGFQAYFRWVAQRHDEFMLLFGGSARHDGEFSAQVRRITNDAAAAIAPLSTWSPSTAPRSRTPWSAWPRAPAGASLGSASGSIPTRSLARSATSPGPACAPSPRRTDDGARRRAVDAVRAARNTQGMAESGRS